MNVEGWLKDLGLPVYFTCLGRGPHMFGAQSADLAAIQDELGEAPLVGFFSNGEISHNRV